MKANEFVEALANIAPSQDKYLEDGFSEEEASWFRNGYICKRRDDQLSIPGSDELVVLMNKWSTGGVFIGMIELINKPIQTIRGLQVGEVEADPLLISNATGEIVSEELGTDGHQLWCVAESGERFLDAAIVAARFLTITGIFEDLSKAKSTAEECAALAGGPNYHVFYTMLLGAEE